MYKLTIIAGPNRGSTFAVQDGETSIGRQTGNSIILPSTKVSKRHCTLVVSNGEVVVKDAGSSNGTFVNGALSKLRRVKIGDRISIGEFVLELSNPSQRGARPSVPAGMGNNVIPFPGFGGASPMITGTGGSLDPNQPPKDLKSKLIWAFERQLMPVFYGANLKTEWKMLCLALFGVWLVFNLLISVYPMIEANRSTVIRETGRRAQYMAKQIVERNSTFLAAREETKADVGVADRAEGVRMAALIDMDNRILAPPSKMNQYLTAGPEGSLAVKMRNAYRTGLREGGMVTTAGEFTVIAIEPVKVLSNQAGRNVTVAMAIVSLDTSISTPDTGDIGMIYSETLIYSALFGLMVLLILYRVTLKPFEVLNDDIDKVLKGELKQVTHEFRVEELNPLWDVINSALQRIQRPTASSGGTGMMTASGSEDVAAPMRMIGAFAKFGVLILDQDRRITFLNSPFEEASGIRGDGAMGQDVAAVARDSALGPFVADLIDRSQGGETVTEDFEFSGVSYKFHATALGTSNGPAKAYCLAVVKNEG